MSDSQISYRGKTVNYCVKGQGDTVVLLHGFIENLHIWDTFINHLSHNYKVIAIDLPGHGQSSLQFDVQTMNLMAQVVDFVVTAEKSKSICLIGHSMGGFVALAYANLYPEKIKGLGLFHSSAAKDTISGTQNRIKSIQLIEENHSHFMHEFIPDLFTENHRIIFKQTIKSLQEQAAKIEKECLIACQKGMIERPDSIHLIEKASYPIMYIIGKKDPRGNYEQIIQQAVKGKHVEILLLEDCSHMGFIEQTAKSLNFTASFAEHCFKL